MRCPFCDCEDTNVKDSRPSEEGAAIRRRRICPSCEGRFTTYERIQLREMTVLKSDGKKEIFDREKLIKSLFIPLRKRPVSMDDIEQIATTIVRRLENLGENDVTSHLIGEKVMEELAQIDQVAYVRYASVYKDFREAKDFDKFIRKLSA